MFIFKIVGVVLIFLGTACGLLLLLDPFGVEVEGSILTFWLLYVICFIGGFLLYSLGSKNAAATKVLKTLGGILLVLGVASAIAIFLAKVRLIAGEASLSLWLLFLICTGGGIVSILGAEGLGAETVRDLMKRK